MKNFIKILGVTALTALFVACGGADFSLAPAANADEPAGAAGAAGQTAGEGCTCEPGPQGDQGIQGAQGPAGPQGAPGKDGTSAVCVNDLDSCPPGVPGATGPAGPAGPQGPMGAAGIDGADGAKGATGPAGPAGPQGPVGQPGQPGPAGPAGAPGKDGTSITKSSLYTRSSGLAAADAIAYCDDENDVVLTGTCTGQGVFWGIIGPYLPTNPDFKSGWECKSSNVGGNPVGATAVCLEVP